MENKVVEEKKVQPISSEVTEAAKSSSPKGAQASGKKKVKGNTLNEIEGKKIIYALPINQMIERVRSEPPMKMIYSGIKENSVGFIFGPAKSGKTIFCENLGICIAAGLDSYLDMPIVIQNRKVLFLSLEEFYTGRTERNEKQVLKVPGGKSNWTENYIVVNENMPRYLVTDEDWKIVANLISGEMPGVVFIDSLSRMYEGSIEESSVAKDVMKRLRELTDSLKVTCIVIHHCPKLYNSALTISSLAGSRIIGQEADFIIGINKTIDNKRYIKEVAFRYAQDNAETVRTFDIDDSLWLNITGDIAEAALLASNDGRKDDVNYLKIFDFIAEKGEANKDKIVTYAEIEAKFVKTGIMSGQTAHAQLNKLVADGKLAKPRKGDYKLVA